MGLFPFLSFPIITMSDKKRFVFAERSKSLQIAATCGLGVVSEEQALTGYQIYIVEQWLAEIKHTPFCKYLVSLY